MIDNQDDIISMIQIRSRKNRDEKRRKSVIRFHVLGIQIITEGGVAGSSGVVASLLTYIQIPNESNDRSGCFRASGGGQVVDGCPTTAHVNSTPTTDLFVCHLFGFGVLSPIILYYTRNSYPLASPFIVNLFMFVRRPRYADIIILYQS